MDKEKILKILFVERVKFKYYIYKECQNRLEILYNNITSSITRNASNFDNNVINQYIYGNVNTKLNDILDSYKELFSKKLEIFDIKNNIRFLISINKINNNLKDIVSLNGAKNLEDIISINFFNENLNSLIKTIPNFKKILIFINKTFNPTSCNVYNNLNKNITSDVVVYNEKITESNDIGNYDYKNMSKLKNILFTKILKKNSSLLEHIYGLRIYIKYKNNIIVMNGYLNADPLNISRVGGIIGEKDKNIKKRIEKININDSFKYGYIEQLSLRDFLVNSTNEIIEQIQMAYNLVKEYQKKTISQVVKDFLNKSVEEQRDIIILFLLAKEDVEIQYMAYLLYDMISNDSYLLKAQPMSEQIYNSLHWSIQKIFKNTSKMVNEYKKKIINFDTEDISYEKRIILLKAPDSVKQKAMDKYKEISNKGNDNVSKSQQYLDSLLKIPFSIYKKEKILVEFDIFKSKINIFINQLLSFFKEFNNYTNSDLDNLKNIVLFYNHKKKILYDDIEKILYKLNSINTKIMNNFIDSININNVENVIDNYVLTNKNKDIELFIKNINSSLTNINKKKYCLKEKNNKLNYKKALINLISKTDIDSNLKKKFLYNIQNKQPKTGFNLIDSIESINSIEYLEDIIEDNDKDTIKSEYETINDKIFSLNDEWKDYKIERKYYLNSVDDILNNAVFGQDDAKTEVKRIIGQWMNGDISGYCLGFEGPPGTGKTSLAKKGIANCLLDNNGESRPFSFIALGGSSNGSTFEGHNYTYVGSTYGKIVDILIETQCMNPIIYIDELDKLSNTENGKEIVGILTHLTDSTQNDHFNDKYFSGINFDLSKVLFIFSYNDYNLIDPILADRIHRIKFNYLSKTDKITIMKKYLIPELLETVGFNQNKIIFSDTVLEYIIVNYTHEAGVRKLKEKIFEIIREINLNSIYNNDTWNETIQINVDFVKKIFENKPKTLQKTIASSNCIGLVNGLYATSSGVGGITIIEAYKCLSDTKLSLTITGQQGDVMKESIKCAKTIAWNLIPKTIKKKIIKDWEENHVYGIHIHCPEASTPKDGPSAGGAITLSIVSLLCGVKVKRTVAMTGEIDLNGGIHAIGGLDLKIDGGKMAGVKTILVPKENKQDLDIIKNKKPDILKDIEIIIIDTIWDILKHSLEPNNIKFNNYV